MISYPEGNSRQKVSFFTLPPPLPCLMVAVDSRLCLASWVGKWHENPPVVLERDKKTQKEFVPALGQHTRYSQISNDIVLS